MSKAKSEKKKKPKGVTVAAIKEIFGGEEIIGCDTDTEIKDIQKTARELPELEYLRDVVDKNIYVTGIEYLGLRSGEFGDKPAFKVLYRTEDDIETPRNFQSGHTFCLTLARELKADPGSVLKVRIEKKGDKQTDPYVLRAWK